MNEEKICIIVLITDERQWQECLLYLNELIIPEKFEVDVIPIYQYKYPAQAYNMAMKSNNAKYKIYLKDTVKIINKKCILDMIDIFNQNRQIGLLGILGSEKCPTNANWWDAKYNYGNLYEIKNGSKYLTRFNSFDAVCKEVEIVIDVLLMTQYDVLWREDILTGNYFYDVAQSIEFKKAGYTVAVVKQNMDWCISFGPVYEKFDEKNNVCYEYDYAKDCFLDEYSKVLFPLVSIWMPTHNRPEYAKVALGCAIAQTYRNVEICISDNSDNEETAQFIAPFLTSKRIKYYRFYTEQEDKERDNAFEKYAEKNFYPYHNFDRAAIPIVKNWVKAWSMADGEYLSLLCDDDWLHPDKASRVLQYYFEDCDVTLVTSYRHVINSDGELCNPIVATEKIFDHDTIIDGEILGKIIILTLCNFIGENIFYHRKYAPDKMIYGYYQDLFFGPTGDIAAWLKLLHEGKAVYLIDGLSGFRMDGKNLQNDLNTVIGGVSELFLLVESSYKNKAFIKNKAEFLDVISKWITIAENILNKADNFNKMFNGKQFYRCLEKAKQILARG
jgi:glycosyltransferase involved in cell wall biosynthesis